MGDVHHRDVHYFWKLIASVCMCFRDKQYIYIYRYESYYHDTNNKIFILIDAHTVHAKNLMIMEKQISDTTEA